MRGRCVGLHAHRTTVPFLSAGHGRVPHEEGHSPRLLRGRKGGPCSCPVLLLVSPDVPSSLGQNSRGRAARASGICGEIAAKCRCCCSVCYMSTADVQVILLYYIRAVCEVTGHVMILVVKFVTSCNA